jgi:hypothetical protein
MPPIKPDLIAGRNGLAPRAAPAPTSRAESGFTDWRKKHGLVGPVLGPEDERARLLDARVDFIARKFDGAEWHGTHWKALCPVHGDVNPSLDIRKSKDGKRVLVKCFSRNCDLKHMLREVCLEEKHLFADSVLVDAVYPYRDEDGNHLFEIVRLFPKDFKSRHYDEDGEHWHVRGIRRVLYRLPELLAADASETVFIVEGEKDAERLMSLGLVATTSPYGACSWRAEYDEHLAGRHVVLIQDKDEAGREYVEKVAASLRGVAASVKVLVLETGKKGSDASDWLDAGHTKEELLDLVRDAEPRAPEEPTGALAQAGSAHSEQAFADARPTTVGCRVSGPPFPTEALPEPLRAFVQRTAEAMCCPVDAPATLMLPVLATFIGRKRAVSPKEGWTELPILWAAYVADTGVKKTPPFKLVTRPLFRKQSELRGKHYADKRDRAARPHKGKDEMPEPSMQQIITTDATLEALRPILLDDKNRGLCYASEELTGWVRGMGQYKGGRGND